MIMKPVKNEKFMTSSSLVRNFHALGLQPGDNVLVHSSLSSLGRVAGGAQTVVSALLEAVGPCGTLMMPSFQKGGEYGLLAAGVVFDVRVSPSEQGLITETFRKMPGVVRSLSPTHCMAAFGKNADKLLEGHENCVVSCGKGSPFEKLIQLDGKILLIGVANSVNTTLHYVENINGAPTISRDCFKPVIIDMEGKSRIVPTYAHMPGLMRRYDRVEGEFISKGIQKSGRVGTAACELINARKMAAYLAKRIRKDPLYLIEVFYLRRNHY